LAIVAMVLSPHAVICSFERPVLPHEGIGSESPTRPPMIANITTELTRKLPAGPIDIRDARLPGFVLRIRANGKASYLAVLGRGRTHTIGAVSKLTAGEARQEAQGLLGDVAKAKSRGEDPFAALAAKRAATKTITFKTFIEDHFEPWATEHQKRGAETTQRLRTTFADFLNLRLTEITPWTVEKWRTERLKREGRRPRPATVNSQVTMLKAALKKAVVWKLLAAQPLGDVKALKADKNARIRYLTPAEEKRLRAALDARDQVREARRARANVWRRERGYAEWPTGQPDHLTTIVLLALNTGMRKGEIFELCWRDVDFAGKQVTIRGEGAKSGQTRYIPLNTEAVDILTQWQKSAPGELDAYVFPGREKGERLDDVKKGWMPIVAAAKVEKFRFHDLRHTFASKLVMAAVDLNTVRELLGHADIKMVLRYAHLSPEHKAAAVAKLVRA
jgi:integrase